MTKKLIIYIILLCCGVASYGQTPNNIELHTPITVSKDSTIAAYRMIQLAPGFRFQADVRKGLHLTIMAGGLTVYHKDSENGTLISGGRIRVADANDLQIGIYTVNNGTVSIPVLNFGTYTISEIAPPAGYDSIKTAQRVTINSNATSTVTFQYGKTTDAVGCISIRCVNSSNQTLSSGKYKLLDSNNQLLGTYTAVNGEISISKLAFGKYTVVEETPPSGYIAQSSPREITLTDNNCGEIIYSYQLTPLPSGCINVYNKDKETGNQIDGGKVKLINSNKVVIGIYDMPQGEVNIPNLTLGTYGIVSASTPAGYIAIADTQFVNITTTACQDVVFEYDKDNEINVPNSVSLHYTNDMRVVKADYTGIRVGEYYWMNNNFSHYEPRGQGIETPIEDTQGYLNRYFSNKIKHPNNGFYNVNIDEFTKYYGRYYSRDAIDDMVIYGKMYEGESRQLTGWAFPKSKDYRQLFGMCDMSQLGVLGEHAVRFDLAPKEYDNPMAFNIQKPEVSPYSAVNIYWFGSENTGKYKFGLMPGGFRRQANENSDIRGDFDQLFYATWMATATSQVGIHDYIDSETSKSWSCMNARWCRKLTDEELGYKLFIKINNLNELDKEAKDKLLEEGNDMYLLREIRWGFFNASDIDIIKIEYTNGQLQSSLPNGYVELPNGYIRGLYVQYYIDNETPQFSIEKIVSIAANTQDSFLRRKSLKISVRDGHDNSLIDGLTFDLNLRRQILNDTVNLYSNIETVGGQAFIRDISKDANKYTDIDYYLIDIVSVPNGYTAAVNRASVISKNYECVEYDIYIYKESQTSDILVFKHDRDLDIGNTDNYTLRSVNQSYTETRIGEYYWTTSNFHHAEFVERAYRIYEGWNKRDLICGNEYYNNLTQNAFKTYLEDIDSEDIYNVTPHTFERHYGKYYADRTTYRQAESGNIFEYPEKNIPNLNWNLPEYKDIRQLLAMCDVNNSNKQLGRQEILNNLAAKLGQNELAYNILDMDWFATSNTNKYGFSMMPGGYRETGYTGINITGYWPNSEIRDEEEFLEGKIKDLFYKSYFAVKPMNFVRGGGADPGYFAYVGDSISTRVQKDERWVPVRWCRRLSDQELGYKLYIKATDQNVAGSQAWTDMAGGNEIPLLKQIRSGAVSASGFDIVKKGLSESAGSGYIELPNGYIRGFYVQYILDKTSSVHTVTNIMSYASKVKDDVFAAEAKTKEGKKDDLFEFDNDKTSKQPLSIYPNPVRDILNIQSADNIVTASILDASGNRVMELSNASKQINVSSLANGMYMITIQTETESKVFKFVKK